MFRRGANQLPLGIRNVRMLTVRSKFLRYHKRCVQTFVLSDLHLTEAHHPDPRRPLWMAYKREDHFIDEDFAQLLAHAKEACGDEPAELVLNGDIFDFDAVTQLPEDPPARIDWLARVRGLASEEWMSAFKMEVIIRDHPVWFSALREFIARGNRVVFVAGNHDVELAWPSVQRLIAEALDVEVNGDSLVFCEWFYLSGNDTYISHGHQYDPNCVVQNPIDPLIEVHGRPRVRIPFGDLAGRYMLNGMGYFNPNATENYIMSALQYVRFFLRYMLLTQPLLLWSWFWSAMATLWISLTEHWRPPMRDPLRVDEKVADVARRSNTTPAVVRKLEALNVASACAHPVNIMKVLWLDRGLLFLLLMFACWQLILHINVALPISTLWVFVPIACVLPPYLVYASRVKATVFDKPLLNTARAELIHKITGAKTVVFGHTHKPLLEQVGPVRYLNGGFWSAAFAEPECKNRIGTQTFVWIRPTPSGERAATMYELAPGDDTPKVFVTDAETGASKRPVSIRPPVGER